MTNILQFPKSDNKHAGFKLEDLDGPAELNNVYSIFVAKLNKMHDRDVRDCGLFLFAEKGQ